MREAHAGGIRLVIAVTGGGSGAISRWSARLPARCGSILAAVVPYAPEAPVEWLGGKPDEFCSSWTARAMAMAAYSKATQYDPQATTCGVACTASLASDRPKRGAIARWLLERHDHGGCLGGVGERTPHASGRRVAGHGTGAQPSCRGLRRDWSRGATA